MKKEVKEILKVRRELDCLAEEFCLYLKEDLKFANNTVESYKVDLKGLIRYFVEEIGINSVSSINSDTIHSYIAFIMENEKKTASSVNRSVCAVRKFVKFLEYKSVIAEPIVLHYKFGRVGKRNLKLLTIEEVESLKNACDLNTLKGLRNRVLIMFFLELGLKPTDIVEMKFSQINKSTLISSQKTVILNKEQKKLFDVYKAEVLSKSNQDYVIVNHQGKKITRQGLWKILKELSSIAGITSNISPEILRSTGISMK